MYKHFYNDGAMSTGNINARFSELREHLRGIMPLCCNGKKIRDDTGYWHEVEAYFKKHLDTAFTHGICNDCIKTLYPDQYRKWQDQESACQAPHNEEAT